MTAGGSDQPSSPDRRRDSVSAAIVILGLVTTALSVVLAMRTDRSNEERLLQVQTDQAAAVLEAATMGLQEPLSSALDVAASVLPRRLRTVFEERFSRNTGTDQLFQVGALWRRGPQGLSQVAAVGGRPGIAAPSTRAQRLVARSLRARTMAVDWSTVGKQIRIVFVLADPASRFVVFAERSVPRNRQSPVDADSGFAGLDYALYLGDGSRTEDMVTTDVEPSTLPLDGLTYSTTVPFGDDVLRLVTRPREHLGSDLGWQLPWLLGVGGPLATLLTLLLTRQLRRSRERAEADTRTITSLYRRVEGLYDEQRELSVRLQRALLPRTLPQVPGFDIAATYVAGAQGIDIGGDWYSVVEAEGDEFAFVVGDVSGHGIDAVAEMARARFTLRAYLTEGDSPAAALEKCAHQFDIAVDGHMVTVLAGTGNWRTGELTIASAGHPAPLAVSADGATAFLPVRTGPPLGAGVATFEATTATLDPGTTLLCFTDGLVERRTEDIDAGFARLAEVSAAHHPASAPLEPFLDELLERMRDPDRSDDIAVLALRRNLELGSGGPVGPPPAGT